MAFEPKSAEIGYFSLEPVYDYKTAKRKLVAYRVNANVSLKLKDFSKIAPDRATAGRHRCQRKSVPELHSGRYGFSQG